MKWLKAFLSLVAAIVTLVFGMLIAMNNPDLVSLSFLHWQLPGLPVGTLVLLVFGLGCVLGLAVNLVWIWRLQVARRRLSKELQNTVKRVEQIQ